MIRFTTLVTIATIAVVSCSTRTTAFAPSFRASSTRPLTRRHESFDHDMDNAQRRIRSMQKPDPLADFMNWEGPEQVYVITFPAEAGLYTVERSEGHVLLAFGDEQACHNFAQELKAQEFYDPVVRGGDERVLFTRETAFFRYMFIHILTHSCCIHIKKPEAVDWDELVETVDRLPNVSIHFVPLGLNLTPPSERVMRDKDPLTWRDNMRQLEANWQGTAIDVEAEVLGSWE